MSATGEITLDGGDDGTIEVAGTLNASGKATGQTGGTVEVTGQDVDIASTAKVDVSGQAGGGAALIGGDLHGGGTLRHALTTTVATGAQISADATSNGSGGKVVVWSDDQTNYAGAISARGGSAGGNGGSAEVSSHGVLAFTGSADLLAPYGQTGTLLLDPENVTIAATGDTPSLSSANGGPITLAANQDNSILSVATLQNALALADVTVSTGSSGTQAGDITVASNINWSSNNGLTLSAFRNIAINANITNTSGAGVDLRADNTGTGIGTVSFGSGDTISTSGAVSIFYNPSANPVASAVNPASYVNPTESFSGDVTGGGALTAYMLVNSVSDLQNMQNNLTGDYALGRDIDASATTAWNSGAGFMPIGNGTTFSGVFDGLGNAISNLTINNPASDLDVGLFGDIGASGIVRNINLTNVDIAASGSILVGGFNVNYQDVGALAGRNDGSISDSSSSGLVSGDQSAGGLIGANFGNVSRSYSSASVSGGSVIGGLIGQSDQGDVSNSYATGSVTGTGSDVGGLVGLALITPAPPPLPTPTGSFSNVYATGAVISSSSLFVGGLVGESGGISFSNAYWDTQSSGLSTSADGVGLTTSQLKAALPSGFDSTVWSIDGTTNGGYPHLQWQKASGGSVTPGVTINFGAANIPPPPPPPSSQISVTWSVADVTSTYGAQASLGKVNLAGILPGDIGSVSPILGLFNGNTEVTLSPTLPAGIYTERVVGFSYKGVPTGDYTLSSTGDILGTLTINPKVLTWSVPNTPSIFGTTPIPGQAMLTGIVGSDKVEGIVEVTTNNSDVFLSPTTPVGSYEESVVGLTGSAANNYVLASGGNMLGILTIVAPTGLNQYLNVTNSTSNSFLFPNNASLAVGPEFAIQSNPQLARADAIGMEYVESDPNVKDQVTDLLMGLPGDVFSQSKLAEAVSDIISDLKGAWDTNADIQSGNTRQSRLAASQLLLGIFVQVLGPKAVTIPLDVAKVVAAVETSYWAGFLWALNNPTTKP